VHLCEGIYFFIYDLLSDAVSSSEYIASNTRTIDARWISKDVEGSGRAYFKLLSRQLLEETKENQETG
jgi:hypothetical protein